MSTVKELASTRKAVTGPVGVVQIRGDVTPAVGARLMHLNADWLHTNNVQAQVVSYVDAAVRVTADGMLANAMHALSAQARFRTPTVFLVRPDQASLFGDYAALMRRDGLLERAVFTDADAAQRWAAQQARVQMHWAACQRRLQACFASPNTGPAAPLGRLLSP